MLLSSYTTLIDLCLLLLRYSRDKKPTEIPSYDAIKRHVHRVTASPVSGQVFLLISAQGATHSRPYLGFVNSYTLPSESGG